MLGEHAENWERTVALFDDISKKGGGFSSPFAAAFLITSCPLHDHYLVYCYPLGTISSLSIVNYRLLFCVSLGE